MGEWIDLSSNKPHVTVDCPVCGDQELSVKIDNLEHTTRCDCNLKYTMKLNPDESVCISFVVPNELL